MTEEIFFDLSDSLTSIPSEILILSYTNIFYKTHHLKIVEVYNDEMGYIGMNKLIKSEVLYCIKQKIKNAKAQVR